VHFGTLDYLKADRFGFLMGIDDLFWRSLVWAAESRLSSEDTRGSGQCRWMIRIPAGDTGCGISTTRRSPGVLLLTAPRAVEAHRICVYRQPAAGSAERASVAADIRQGILKVAPHTFAGITYGNLYWNGSNGAITDTQWSTNLSKVLTWKTGQGGNDAISTSRSLVCHYWDLSDNTGYDL